MTVSSESSPPQGRRRFSPEVRRRQIIEKATTLIATSGFNAISLADIAHACGIQGPSVLHYFPTMAQILEAVLRARDEQSPVELPERAELLSPTGFKRLVRRFHEQNIQNPELMRLFVVVSAEAIDQSHPAHGYFKSRQASVHEQFSRALVWKKDPELAAFELVAAWEGLERLWAMNPQLSYLEVWDQFADRFFISEVSDERPTS